MERLVAGEIVNRIVVPEKIKMPARLALQRMLDALATEADVFDQ